MTIDPSPWKILHTQCAYRNRWIGVNVDTVRLPNGAEYDYTRLDPAGVGVGIVGFDAAGRILLEREYRHGVSTVIWQIPGGLADADEDLQSAGLRELREETGYAPVEVTADTVCYLGAVWDNPAMGTAMSHIYRVRGLALTVDSHTDEGEFVTLHWVEPAWIKEAVRNGTIQDRVVVAAVAYLLLNGEL